MKNKNNFFKIFYLAPEFFIIFINLSFVAASIKFSYPFLFVFFVALAFNLVFKLEDRVLFSPLSLPFIFGVMSFVSHNLAKYHLHGRLTALIIQICLLTGSLIIVFRNRDRISGLLTTVKSSAHSDNLLTNVCLLIICAVFWIHSILFWYFSYYNSTAAHFILTASSILKRGFFHFPIEDFLYTGDSCYPNFWTHFFVLTAPPPIKWESFMRYAANTGSFFVIWSFSLIYILFSKGKQYVNELTGILLALLCSYSFFTIIPEFGSDTPIFIFMPTFFYFLIRGTQDKNSIYLYLSFATAIFSFWFRANVGLGLTGVFLIFMFLHWDLILPLFNQRKSFKIFILFLTAYIGTYWQIQLFQLTGNPSYPYSGGMGTAILSVGNKNIFQEILYHFFALNVSNTSVYKAARGVLHGFTYSTFLTLSSILGIILYFKKSYSKNLNLPAQLSFLSIIVSLSIFFLCGYHYKFLYFIYMPVTVFSLIALVFLTQKLKSFIPFFILIFLCVFIVSYLMYGFGHTPKKWAIANYLLKRDRNVLYDIKDYSKYVVAQNIKKYLTQNDRILFFHLEPGFQISYYLNLRPFSEEPAYKYPSVHELYKVNSEKAAINWLKKNNIKVIVFGYPPLIDYYVKLSSKDSPHLLPIMLKKKSKYFIWEAEDVAVVPD